nr:MAG TPA: hypothetical protein [Caudoviricetes sp.]
MTAKAVHIPLFGDGWDAFAVAPCAALRGKVESAIVFQPKEAGLFNA